MKPSFFSDWKLRLTTGWGFVRLLRLGLSLIIITESFKNYDLLFGALGLVLLAQALLNAGCCAVAGCEVNSPVKETTVAAKESDITFKEIK